MVKNIGAHVSSKDPLAAAKRLRTEAVQIFIGSPHSWTFPRYRDDSDLLLKSSVRTYVHAPYIVNIASPKEDVQVKSVYRLANLAEVAAAIGSPGVVVHGGSAMDSVRSGFARWHDFFQRYDLPAKILIENTASGKTSMTRYLREIEALWAVIGGFNVGFCLDTCHAWAAGDDLDGLVPRLLDIVGKIDVVHANGSRDGAGSGRDRHANYADSKLPFDLIVAMIEQAGAEDVILETPGHKFSQDLAMIRSALGK